MNIRINHPLIIINFFLVLLTYLFFSCKTEKTVALKSSQSNFEKKTESLKTIDPFEFPDTLNVKNYLENFNNSVFWDKQTENFYKKRNYQTAWNIDKELSKNLTDFLKSIDKADTEGLNPEEYNYYPIIIAINKIQVLTETDTIFNPLIARLDILLTNSYLKYASHLLNGKINPDTIHDAWKLQPEKKDLSQHLTRALDNEIISQSLNVLKPDNEQYGLLKLKLKELKKIREGKGNWTKVRYFKTLKEGDNSEDLIRVKKYLYETGYLGYKNVYSTIFDNDLEIAVIRFQERHGIKPDGIIGPGTLNEMNIHLEQRIEQIKINLERLRWLPENLGENYISINLPEYYLRYYRNGMEAKSMKVVIGKTQHYSPLIIDTLEYLVFSPTWNVPRSISTKEFLPILKNNPNYLVENNYLLIDYNSDTIRSDSIHWQEINKDSFNFRIVQKPGSNNALGKVKFIFPNNYSIYMHDTPADHLFNEYERDFSHGCVRLEKPFELAHEILNNHGYGIFSINDINELAQNEKPKRIYLKENLPVYFFYYTAWVDERGYLQYREDIYDFDQTGISKLNRLKTPEIQIQNGFSMKAEATSQPE